MQSQKAFVVPPQSGDQQAWVTPTAVVGLGFDLFQYRIIHGLHTGEDLGVEFSDDGGVFLIAITLRDSAGSFLKSNNSYVPD